MADVNSVHEPGSPFWLKCAFCGYPTDSAISAADQSRDQAFPICAHCYAIESAMIELFGNDVSGWALYKFTHTGQGDPADAEDKLPETGDVLAEAERIVKG